MSPGRVVIILKVWSCYGIDCEIALRRMSQNTFHDKSTLVQVMAWCRQATSHNPSQCWLNSTSPYGVTKPQWIDPGIQRGMQMLTKRRSPRHICLNNEETKPVFCLLCLDTTRKNTVWHSSVTISLETTPCFIIQNFITHYYYAKAIPQFIHEGNHLGCSTIKMPIYRCGDSRYE